MIKNEIPLNKYVIHCKETKYNNVNISAKSYEDAETKWQSIAKKRDYITLHQELEVISVSWEGVNKNE